MVGTIRPKRNRQNIPSGHIVGRTSKGSGSEEMIPLTSLGQAMVQAGAVSPPGAQMTHEYMEWFGQGLFAAAERTPIIGPVAAVSFPSAALLDVAKCKYAPTADAVIRWVQDADIYLTLGTGLICSITFLAGALVGTFAYSATSLTVGQGTHILAPLIADATFGEVTLIFCGDR